MAWPAESVSVIVQELTGALKVALTPVPVRTPEAPSAGLTEVTTGAGQLELKPGSKAASRPRPQPWRARASKLTLSVSAKALGSLSHRDGPCWTPSTPPAMEW